MASFDLSNLGGQMENLKFYCGFWCGKKGRFWCILKWKYQFWLSEALAKFEIVLLSKISYHAGLLQQQLKCINKGKRRLTLLWLAPAHNSLFTYTYIKNLLYNFCWSNFKKLFNGNSTQENYLKTILETLFNQCVIVSPLLPSGRPTPVNMCWVALVRWLCSELRWA